MSEKQAKGGGEGGEKKASKMPLFAMMAVVLLLNSLVVAKLFMSGDKKPKDEKPIEEIGPKMPLEEFLVNLGGSNEHYLKATIALGLRKGLTEEKFKEETAPIRDAIIMVMSNKKTEEIATTEGKEKLKEEIRSAINKDLGSERDPKIIRVYFTNFTAQ